MFYTLRDEYDIQTDGKGFESDFRAMLDWFRLWGMKYFMGRSNNVIHPILLKRWEEINSVLVKSWIEYRDTLTNSQGFDRSYLELCARRMCEPDDLNDFNENLDSTSDGHLMALGRIFYSQPDSNLMDDSDCISIRWSIEEVKHICPKVTDQQARDVLQFMKTNHNPEIGINWDVIDSAIDEVLPEIAAHSEAERHLDVKYANDIIDGHPELYNAIEIHGVVKQVGPDIPGGEWIELNDERPNQYCVYLHMVSGGISCVGDFSTHELAVAYAEELSVQYNWVVRNFCD